MAKKIFIAITGGIALLLALFFAIVILVQNKDFFGTVIAWLLSVGAGILAMLVVYLVVSQVADAVRENKFDESKLSERHIEKILTTGSRSKAKMQLDDEEKVALEDAVRKQEEHRKDEERLLSVRRQEEYEEMQREAQDRERLAWEANVQRPKMELEAKAARIGQAEQDAYNRSREAEDERDRRLARAEYEALQRAREEALVRLAEEEETLGMARRRAEQDERLRLAQEDERRLEAVESMRKQSESLEQARRRAALASASERVSPVFHTGTLPVFNSQSMAAYHSQPMPAVNSQSMPAYNSQSMPAHQSQSMHAVGSQNFPAQRPMAPAPQRPGLATAPQATGNTVWDKMQGDNTGALAGVAPKSPAPPAWQSQTGKLPLSPAQTGHLATGNLRPPSFNQTGSLNTVRQAPTPTAQFLQRTGTLGGTGTLPPSNAGYVVPRTTPQAPAPYYAGAKGLPAASAHREAAMQAASSRSMGGSRPLLDTTRFTAGELASFQDMQTMDLEGGPELPKASPQPRYPGTPNKWSGR